MDSQDGSVQWSTEMSGRYGLAPVVAGESVYAATTNPPLRVFEMDGTERWTVTVGERIRSSPVVLDEYVFLGRGGGSPAFLAFG
jgi:hypothetical protein